MILSGISSIAQIVLLRSDVILVDLLQETLFGVTPKHSSLLESIQALSPNRFRQQPMCNALDNILSDRCQSDLDYGFAFLGDLYDEFFIYDGQSIIVNPDKVDLYSGLICKIHPYNLIGYNLATLMTEGRLTAVNIYEYAKHCTPLALSTDRLHKEYADNHIHLGGAQDPQQNFISLLEHPALLKQYDLAFTKSLPRIGEFSFINCGKLSIGAMLDIARVISSNIHRAILTNDISVMDGAIQDVQSIARIGKAFAVSCPTRYTLDAMISSLSVTTSFGRSFFDRAGALLRQAIGFYHKGYFEQFWFVYNVLLFYFLKQHSESRSTSRLIKIFIHISNIIRSYTVMSQNIGLGHFVEFFDSKLRKTGHKYSYRSKSRNVAHSIFSTGTWRVEGKVSPDAVTSSKGEIWDYKFAFDEAISKIEYQKIRDRKQKIFPDSRDFERKYQFSVHFHRGKETKCTMNSKNDLLTARYSSLRHKLKYQAKRLDRTLCAGGVEQKINILWGRQKCEEILRYQEKLKTTFVDLSRLISSLDIAGDETATPPEVYAPIIRYLRRGPRYLDNMREQYYRHIKGDGFCKRRKLHLSVHAGEDFDHILTGMRRVDETIEFYKMSNRDRLGHALAVGISPHVWLKRNGDICMKKQDLLDDYLWLYYQMKEVLACHPVVLKLYVRYEGYLYKLIEEIYGDVESETMLDDYYRAWELRQYCPIEMKRFLDNRQGLNISSLDEYIKESLPRQEVSYSETDRYKKLYRINEKYQHCGKVRRNGDKTVFVRFDDTGKNASCNYKVITPEDLDLLELIQDFLIEKICQKEIIIETNPSSNVYISFLQDFSEHPIFRWDPINKEDLAKGARFNLYGIRKSKVKICVNSDDPAIFLTTLPNEFQLLKNAAIPRHSGNCENVEAWLEKIRMNGLDIFDYNHLEHEYTKI